MTKPTRKAVLNRKKIEDIDLREAAYKHNAFVAWFRCTGRYLKSNFLNEAFNAGYHTKKFEEKK